MLLLMLVVPSKLLLIIVFLPSLLPIEFSRIIATMAAGVWRRRQFKPLIIFFGTKDPSF